MSKGETQAAMDPMPDGDEGRAGQWAELWAQFSRNRLALAGFVIFVLFFLVAFAGFLLTRGDSPILDPALVRLPDKLRPPLSSPRVELLRPEQLPPTGVYVLGTDDLGRDVFARMMQGAWVSLTVGFVAVGISVFIGIIVGGIAGYYGERPMRLGAILMWVLGFAGIWLAAQGRFNEGAMVFFAAIALGLLRRSISGKKNIPIRVLDLQIMSVDALVTGIIDIMLCFPSFFLVLTVVAILPASIYNIMAVIGLTSWMGAARFVRAEFLSLREQDFVTAARSLGLSDARIIFRHMMPNAIGPVLVSATLGIAGAILTEAGLSFLGFGVPPPHATWGNILSDGRRFLFDAPWLTLIPGVAILVVVLAFNLFGEGMREVVNPRLRERVP